MSCRHVTIALLNQAKSRVEHAHSNLNNTMICVSCGVNYKGLSHELHKHQLKENHFLCVGARKPHELWCRHCGDYVYVDAFDAMLQKKRNIACVEPIRNIHTMRGFCNMGATCFMNSVLQVILNNASVLKAFLSVPEKCSFGGQVNSSSSSLSTTTTSIATQDSISTISQPSTSSSNGVNASYTSNMSGSTNMNGVVPDRITENETSSRSQQVGCICCEVLRLLKDVHNINGSTSSSGGGNFSLVGGEEKRQRRGSFDSDLSTGRGIASNQPIAPSNLLYVLWCHADYLAGYDQQDAHEFMIALLDGFDTHMKLYHDSLHIPPNSVDLISSETTSESIAGNDLNSEQCLVPSSLLLSRRPISPRTSPGSSVPGAGAGILSSLLSANSPHSPPSAQRMSLSATEAASLFRTPVNRLFAGIMSSSLQCLQCGSHNSKDELFLDISLSLPSTAGQISAESLSMTDLSDKAPRNTEEGLQLLDCLREFTAKETLGEHVMCERCGQGTACSKQLSIRHSPRVLILQLKRFDPVLQCKLTTQVDFPLKGLDLSVLESAFRAGNIKSDLQTCSADILPTINASPDRTHLQNEPAYPFRASHRIDKIESTQPHSRLIYDLQGLVCHSGSLFQGHYISYVRAPEDNNALLNESRWMRCDDEVVTEVSDDVVREAEGYLFIYVRQEGTSR